VNNSPFIVPPELFSRYPEPIASLGTIEKTPAEVVTAEPNMVFVSNDVAVTVAPDIISSDKTPLIFIEAEEFELDPPPLPPHDIKTAEMTKTVHTRAWQENKCLIDPPS
jgi:hypothetical protein